MKIQKILILSALCALSVPLFTACTTTAPTAAATVSDKVTRIVAQVPNDVQLVLVPVLQKNPRYAPDVALLGATLPTLLQNGPIDAGSIAGALASIPNLTAEETKDLIYVQVGLPAALQLYSAISGKDVVLYTDPNVAAIVNAFCAGLVKAAGAVPKA
jgi:hypothetical protein